MPGTASGIARKSGTTHAITGSLDTRGWRLYDGAVADHRARAHDREENPRFGEPLWLLQVRKAGCAEAQIIGFLREADAGLPVKDLCRQHGFSEASYYLWRSKFGGMSVSDAKRLKELETENGRLEKLLAESQLEIEVTREVLQKNGGLTGSRRWCTVRPGKAGQRGVTMR